MAQIEYMHVCDYAFPVGDKPSFVGIFTQITPPSFPYPHPFMSIGIQLRGNPLENFSMRVSITGPEGQVVVNAGGTGALGQEGRAFVVMNFVGTTFPQRGPYAVAVSSGEQLLATEEISLR